MRGTLRGSTWPSLGSLVVAAALGVAGCHSLLDRDAFRGEVRALASIGAESVLLYDLRARGSTSQHFFEEHRRDLFDKLHDAQDALARGVADPSLERPRSEARAAARDLARELSAGTEADRGRIAHARDALAAVVKAVPP